jgi:Xaa-Pro aminopeptidase
MTTAQVDALLLMGPENRRYLSGFSGEDTQCDESAGALLISADTLLLATDSRFVTQAETEAPFFETYCYREGLHAALPELLVKLKTKRLGFESVWTSYWQYQKMAQALQDADMKIALVPTEDTVENLRARKSPEEISATRAALEIAETVFEQVAYGIKPGMRERDIAWAMEKKMRESGAEALSFDTIVASGPNSALPHAIPGERKLQTGEPVLFDWGARRDGYCSDTSRTVIIGPPDDTFTRVYQVVRDAQRMAIDAIRAGVSSKKVDAVARDYIDQQGFQGKFGHGLGHGTGLAIHEAPRLGPVKDTRLEAGMLVTVEPGIYLPEWGGVRLENMVVVMEDGAEVLNRLGTDAFQVDA